MNSSLENEQAVKEARSYADRALGQIDTLHLGPLDYNVTTLAITFARPPQSSKISAGEVAHERYPMP